jgi:predicted RNA binding protein YcfA (HicA-like mRNA interferase family)
MTPLSALIELRKIASSRSNISFSQLELICRALFGKPRVKGSHHIFKTPLEGDPRINIQNFKGKAKPYQVRQVIKAAERLHRSIQ